MFVVLKYLNLFLVGDGQTRIDDEKGCISI